MGSYEQELRYKALQLALEAATIPAFSSGYVGRTAIDVAEAFYQFLKKMPAPEPAKETD